VEVVAGNQAGKRGQVLKILRVRSQVVVQGVNMRKKHQKQQQTGGQRPLSAGIVEFEGPLHISNVMVVCGKCDAAVRLGTQREGGKVLRTCRKCNTVVDK
jgi:large subunit ribosomal protein L24